MAPHKKTLKKLDVIIDRLDDFQDDLNTMQQTYDMIEDVMDEVDGSLAYSEEFHSFRYYDKINKNVIEAFDAVVTVKGFHQLFSNRLVNLKSMIKETFKNQ